MAKRKTTAIFFEDLKYDAQKRIIANEMASILNCEPDEVKVENITVEDDMYGYDENPKKQELLEHVHADINSEACLMVWDCFAHEFTTIMKENQKYGTMRKAKITGCVAEIVDIKMTIAAIGVGFKVSRYERYAQVGFPIETAKTDIDRNINQKSEFLMKYLMRHVREELDYWNEGDADTTDIENIMRLKMPYLLRKVVNMEYFRQLF